MTFAIFGKSMTKMPPPRSKIESIKKKPHSLNHKANFLDALREYVPENIELDGFFNHSVRMH